jgi:hypothetical protein
MQIGIFGQNGIGAERRGSALVLSLIAVTTVVVLSASFSQFASAVADRQAQSIDKKQAFYLAEAGLAESFGGFTCGKSGAVASEESPVVLGDGLFWVEATELMPGVFRLDATGMYGSGRARLSLVAQRGIDSVASLGVFAEGQVTVNPGSVIDAYDSTLGVYVDQADKSGAALGSNEAVNLSGSLLKPTTVQGDVTPGQGLTVNTLGSVTITGSTTPALETTVLPAVALPALDLGAAQIHDSPYPLVIPAGSVGYQSLTVQAGSEVEIHGPAQVVLGALTLEAEAQLSFDTSQGPVRLYVTEAASLAASSVMRTSSTNPAEVSFQVPGETALPLAIRSSGPFHGLIYAPEAALLLGAGFEAFGAVVAETLSFEGAVQLHFDRNLAALALDEELPVMLTWQLLEVGNFAAPGADPFDALGVSKNALLKPALAHADQALSIDYYDLSNVYHRYVGLESSFDWNVVKTVISATRDGEEVLIPYTTTPRLGTKKSPGVAPIVDGPMI